MKKALFYARTAVSYSALLLLLWAFWPATITSTASTDALPAAVGQEFHPRVFVDAAKETKKSVVCIQLKILIPSDNPTKPPAFQTASASGFFANKNGFIITNKHVVDKGTDIQVMTLNGEIFPASIVMIHPLLDLAIIKISGAKDGIIYPIKLGDSSLIETGEMVIAIGSPFGLPYTVTMGIISAAERQIDLSDDEKSPHIYNFIQTDTAINPGNSGGPLINLNKEAIGINTMIIGQANIGLNFAIPINLAKDFLIEVERTRLSNPGWIGAHFQKNGLSALFKFRQQKIASTVLVSRIEPNSPAEKSGLKEKDLITHINAVPVEGHLQLEMEIQKAAPGKIITFDVIRSEKNLKIKVTVAERPQN